MLNSSISSRPKFSCGFCLVLNRPSSHTSIAGSFAMATTRSRKLPMHHARIVSICPCSFAGSSPDLAAIMRVASLEPYAPATFEYAVAKWLCQKSVIFSWSGLALCTMRNSQRWRASLMTVFGENAPRMVTLT